MKAYLEYRVDNKGRKLGGLVVEKTLDWLPQACYRHPKIICGEWCPLFRVTQLATGHKVIVLSCASTEVKYDLVERSDS